MRIYRCASGNAMPYALGMEPDVKKKKDLNHVVKTMQEQGLWVQFCSISGEPTLNLAWKACEKASS